MTLAPVTPLAPEGIVVGPDEARVVDEAIGALARASEPYTRGGALVEVIVDEPTSRGVTRGGSVARITPMAEARVREVLAREAVWWGSDGGGGRKQVHPPQWAVRAVMARGQWPGLRPILAVATAPTMRPDGSILATQGYDEASAIYLAPSVDVSVLAQPTRDDARQAVAMLLDVICDFPAAAAARAAWLAGVVTAAARPAIEGPAPMIIADASVRGAGKTLLVDVAALITTGRPAARMIYSGDDAEMRKVITAIALVGDPIVLLDNVSGELGCPSLDAALTGDTWRDRPLGVSSLTPELPLRITWWATGNGLVIGADLSRRALLVRLEPSVERPEERTGWRHPRLLDHVRAHRAELLSAALTIARAYVVAGKPDQGLTPMGSYEIWSDLVRSALVWAGVPDPCATLTEIRATDARAGALRGAIAAWPVADGESATAAQLLGMASADPEWRAVLIEWLGTRSGDLPTARALGYGLRAVRGRVVDGHRISAEQDRNGISRWIRTDVTAGNAGDAGYPQRENGFEPFMSLGGCTSPAIPPSPAGGDDE